MSLARILTPFIDFLFHAPHAAPCIQPYCSSSVVVDSSIPTAPCAQSCGSSSLVEAFYLRASSPVATCAHPCESSNVLFVLLPRLDDLFGICSVFPFFLNLNGDFLCSYTELFMLWAGDAGVTEIPAMLNATGDAGVT